MTQWHTMNRRRGRPPAENPKDGRLIIRLPAEQLAALKSEARSRGVSVAELTRQAIALIVPPKE